MSSSIQVALSQEAKALAVSEFLTWAASGGGGPDFGEVFLGRLRGAGFQWGLNRLDDPTLLVATWAAGAPEEEALKPERVQAGTADGLAVSDEGVRVFVVEPEKSGGKYITDCIPDLTAFLEADLYDSEVGSSLTITTSIMPRSEFEELGDFDGF